MQLREVAAFCAYIEPGGFPERQFYECAFEYYMDMEREK